MTPEDFQDWKQHVVTQYHMNSLAEARQDCLEMLASLLLKSNDKEIGYRAGWVDCLATIRAMLETAEVRPAAGENTQAKAVVVSFEDHLAKRLG